MNHKSITFAIAVIIATAIAVGFAVPQQALAYHHHHHNHDNSITVDQQINQLNECFNGAQCVNEASNTADIGH